jgi:hypothetical protein
MRFHTTDASRKIADGMQLRESMKLMMIILFLESLYKAKEVKARLGCDLFRRVVFGRVVFFEGMKVNFILF